MFQKLEAARKAALKKIITVYSAMGVVLLILLAVMPYDISAVFWVGLFAAAIAAVWLYHHEHQKYVTAYKNLFLKEVLSQEFDEVKVNFEEGFTEDEIRDGHLVQLYDRFHSDDYISGKLNGIPFECSDIHVQDVVRSGKTTTVVTRFQGLYLKVPLKKSFRGWLVVREKEFLDNGNPRGWLSEMPHLDKIEMEDERLNQKFSIYASDGTEAFYLLTPRFLEELDCIEMKLDGRCLFGFWAGYLHVAIDSRTDHFSISLLEEADQLIAHRHMQEINAIKSILEYVGKECDEA